MIVLVRSFAESGFGLAVDHRLLLKIHAVPFVFLGLAPFMFTHYWLALLTFTAAGSFLVAAAVGLLRTKQWGRMLSMLAFATSALILLLVLAVSALRNMVYPADLRGFGLSINILFLFLYAVGAAYFRLERTKQLFH
jgi:hypothetical protein